VIFYVILFTRRLSALTLGLSTEARTALSSATLRELDGERTTLDGVDQDVTRGEQEVRPSTNELNDSTNRVILGVDVEETLGLDALSGGVLANAADIVYPDTGAVVALVGETVDDVEVVVDTLAVGGVESTGCLGVAEVCEVDDVGDGAAGRSGTDGFLLIKLVVQEDVLVPVALSPPSLMAVGSTGVREGRDDLRGRVTVLHGGVIDGHGVLVVADADVAAAELAVGTVVGHTLGIVNVSVLASTTGRGWLARILEVDVLETSLAGLVSGLGTDSEDVLVVPVNNDVVGAANGQLVEQTNEVGLGVECLRCLWVDTQKLLHVEDLNVVTNGLGADDDIVVQYANLAPSRTHTLCGKATHVLDLTILEDLNERSTGELAYDTELAAIASGPSP